MLLILWLFSPVLLPELRGKSPFLSLSTCFTASLVFSSRILFISRAGTAQESPVSVLLAGTPHCSFLHFPLPACSCCIPLIFLLQKDLRASSSPGDNSGIPARQKSTGQEHQLLRQGKKNCCSLSVRPRVIQGKPKPRVRPCLQQQQSRI